MSQNSSQQKVADILIHITAIYIRFIATYFNQNYLNYKPERQKNLFPGLTKIQTKGLAGPRWYFQKCAIHWCSLILRLSLRYLTLYKIQGTMWISYLFLKTLDAKFRITLQPGSIDTSYLSTYKNIFELQIEPGSK